MEINCPQHPAPPGSCLHNLLAVSLAQVRSDSITPLGGSWCVVPGNLLLYTGLTTMGLPLRGVTLSGIQSLFFDYVGSGVNGSHRVLKGER